jgi:hypothetical protein
MIAVLAAAGAVVALSAVGVAAYQRGRRHGRVRMPASLVAELRQHKLECVGEPAKQVALELDLLCEVEPAHRRPR